MLCVFYVMYRLLGVALLVALAAAGCPKQCRCPETTSSLIFEMICKNASLMEVPTGQFQEVFFADLSFNNITTLKSNTFSDNGLVKVLRLYLNNNGLKTIEANAFQGLTHLKLLNLELNDIKELPPNLFQETTELEVLNLNGNKHLLLPDSGLHLPFLDILLLKNCGLKTIPTHFFTNTLSLQYIFLTGNELSFFDPQLISPLTQLKLLDLRNNKFTSFQFDLHENFPEPLEIYFDGNPLDCDCELESTYSLNKQKKLYHSLTCGTPTHVDLHKYLLESCNTTSVTPPLLVSTPTSQPDISNISSTSPTSPTSPTTLRDVTITSSYVTTSQPSSHVIAPEDDDVSTGPSDRTDDVLDMDGYTGWIALSAVVLALIIVALIAVFVKRQNKARDYATPRRFTLLEYDDEEQSYIT